jgi:hypothetical protein
MMTDERYRELAREQYQSDGEIEIDDNAVISRGADNGSYVQAWVWVAEAVHECQNCGSWWAE